MCSLRVEAKLLHFEGLKFPKVSVLYLYGRLRFTSVLVIFPFLIKCCHIAVKHNKGVVRPFD